MSCPWLENRESKDSEKTTKYSQLRLEPTNRDPEYKVNQCNIIMDVLGGCSKEVEKNIKELVGDKCESIMRQMQKAILSSSLHIARMLQEFWTPILTDTLPCTLSKFYLYTLDVPIIK